MHSSRILGYNVHCSLGPGMAATGRHRLHFKTCTYSTEIQSKLNLNYLFITSIYCFLIDLIQKIRMHLVLVQLVTEENFL